MELRFNLTTIVIMVILGLLFFVWAQDEMIKNNVYCVTNYEWNHVESKYCGTLAELKEAHPEMWSNKTSLGFLLNTTN